jgi:nickel-type superoxide dismutase maturation protease
MLLLGHWLLALVRRWRLFRVAGNSMSPTLLHGDWVWVDPKSYKRSRPEANQIVVARHPYRRNVWLIKRVVRALEEDRLVLGGDNPTESTDSQMFGSVPLSLVMGQVRFGYRHHTRSLLRLDV